MGTSQLLMISESLRSRTVWAVLAAVFTAFERLVHVVRNLTRGDGPQAVVSATASRRSMLVRIGLWPCSELLLAPLIAGHGYNDSRAGCSAGRHGPRAFRSSHHCRFRRLGQQAAETDTRMSGSWT
jgi:hypothetical protein